MISIGAAVKQCRASGPFEWRLTEEPSCAEASATSVVQCDPISSVEDCELAAPLVGRDSAQALLVSVPGSQLDASNYHNSCRQSGEDHSLYATEGWCAGNAGPEGVGSDDSWVQLTPSAGDFIVGVATQQRSAGSQQRVTSYRISSEASSGVWTYVQCNGGDCIFSQFSMEES